MEPSTLPYIDLGTSGYIIDGVMHDIIRIKS